MSIDHGKLLDILRRIRSKGPYPDLEQCAAEITALFALAQPAVKLLPRGTFILGDSSSGELKQDCFEIRYESTVYILPLRRNIAQPAEAVEGESLDDVLSAYGQASPEFDASTLMAFIDKYPEFASALRRYATVQLTSVPATQAEIDSLPTDAAQGAVAWPMPVDDSTMQIARIIQRGLNQWPRKGAVELAHDIVSLTHPQAAPAQGGGEMAKIGHLIATQDNRITDSPIFIVQQKRWVCGVDPDYGGERVWVNHARESVEITDEAEIARLDAEYAEEYTAPDGYTLTGKMHVWEFVTACFTEQGCKDYIARDGHNLREPRIYAAGSYRNEEWRSVRKFLMSLAAAPSPEPRS